MAKRKKGSKVQKRAKLRRGNSAKRGKAPKAAKRTVAKGKPRPRPSKKAAHKETADPAVETLVDTSEIPGRERTRTAEFDLTRSASPRRGRNFLDPLVAP
jgi:hypothetical protein